MLSLERDCNKQVVTRCLIAIRTANQMEIGYALYSAIRTNVQNKKPYDEGSSNKYAEMIKINHYCALNGQQ